MAKATNASEGAWKLGRDATLRLSAARRALVLRVDLGTVLVTREGDPEDHVVEGGGAVTIAGKGLVVVWALAGAASVRVEASSRDGAGRSSMSASTASGPAVAPRG